MPGRVAFPHDYKDLKKKRKRFYYRALKFRFNVKYNCQDPDGYNLSKYDQLSQARALLQTLIEEYQTS